MRGKNYQGYKNIIDDMRKIIKPAVSVMLLRSNFEGKGELDKKEFEEEFETILQLAEMAAEFLDKAEGIVIQKEISLDDVKKYCKARNYVVMTAECFESEKDLFYIRGRFDGSLEANGDLGQTFSPD